MNTKKDTSMKRLITKTTIKCAVSSTVGYVIGAAINELELNPAGKVAAVVGSAFIGGFTADKMDSYIDDTLDTFAEMRRVISNAFQDNTTESVESGVTA